MIWIERQARQMNCQLSPVAIFDSKSRIVSEREWQVYVKIRTLLQLWHVRIGNSSFRLIIVVFPGTEISKGKTNVLEEFRLGCKSRFASSMFVPLEE